MAYKKYDAYHLGMQPEEVKDALQGGAIDNTVYDVTYTPDRISGRLTENFATSAEAENAKKNFSETHPEITIRILNFPIGEIVSRLWQNIKYTDNNHMTIYTTCTNLFNSVVYVEGQINTVIETIDGVDYYYVELGITVKTITTT